MRALAKKPVKAKKPGRVNKPAPKTEPRKLPAISSTFAILDVQKGRHKLYRHFSSGGYRIPFERCPENLRVPVIVTGYLSGIWGADDGKSREFEVHVDKVEIIK